MALEPKSVYIPWKEAQKEFNKAKEIYINAYAEMLNRFAEIKDLEGFNICVDCAKLDLGTSIDYTISKIKEKYNIQ